MFCSIVIPLFNKGRYVEEAIASVLAQSHADFEVIVVDDGSEDGGADRAGSVKDGRVRLIRQSNMGVSRARNRGIMESRGELVCFLDADDWYMPQYLETVVSMAKAWPDVAFFGTGYRRVSGQNAGTIQWRAAGVDDARLIEDYYAQYLRCGPIIHTNSVAIRRELLIAMHPCFLPGESSGEDLDLWFRIAEVSPLVYCPAELSAYRIDVAGSLTAADRNGMMLSQAILRVERRANLSEMPPHLRPSALKLVARARVTAARAALIEGRRRNALAFVLRAWRGAGVRRWWLTLAMCFLAPSILVRHWENWRYARVKTW